MNSVVIALILIGLMNVDLMTWANLFCFKITHKHSKDSKYFGFAPKMRLEF